MTTAGSLEGDLAGLTSAERKRLLRLGLDLSRSDSAARDLVDLPREPSDLRRDALHFALGILLSLPLVVLHTHVILGDADSARLLASFLYIKRSGFGYLVDSQEPLLPHLILAPAAALGGIAAMKWVLVASVQLLSGVASYISWKLTRSTIAAIATVLALLSFLSITERTGFLPLYAPMLAFGFIGAFSAHRAAQAFGWQRLGLAVSSAAFLVLSAEAHGEGQVFFVVPALLLLTAPLRRVLPALVRVYVAFCVLYLPRLVINLWDGGLSYLFDSRVDFWVTQHYIELLHAKFYLLDYRTAGVVEYVIRLIGRLPRVMGWTGLGVIAFGAVGLGLGRGRPRRFALASIAVFVGAVVAIRAPYFPRYFTPAAVGAALGAGSAVALLLRSSPRVARATGVSIVLALVATASINFGRTLDQARTLQTKVVKGSFGEMASLINDGRGVIGPRSMYLLFDSTHVLPFGTQFLTEKEFVTYLTWPSDESVVQMLQKRGIGWALVHPSPKWEVEYNDAWLGPAYRRRDRHVEAISRSPHFCLAYRSKRVVRKALGDTPELGAGSYLLYRVGGCRDESTRPPSPVRAAV